MDKRDFHTCLLDGALVQPQASRYHFAMIENLTDNEIAADVWLWDNAEFSNAAEDLLRVLDDQERARRDRQFCKTKGLHWAISRARIRQELAKFTGVAAEDLVFEEDAFGHLTLQQSDLSFSISHDGAWTALAVCESAQVGIDIESIKPISREEMEWPLSQRERADLARVGDADLLQAFYRYWTLKEAFIKALGLGVSFPLEDFDTSPYGSEPALLRVANDTNAPEEWCFEAREARPGLRLALAVKTKGNTPKFSYRGKIGP